MGRSPAVECMMWLCHFVGWFPHGRDRGFAPAAASLWGGLRRADMCISTSAALLACFGRRFGSGWTSRAPGWQEATFNGETSFEVRGLCFGWCYLYRSRSTIWVDRPRVKTLPIAWRSSCLDRFMQCSVRCIAASGCLFRRPPASFCGLLAGHCIQRRAHVI